MSCTRAEEREQLLPEAEKSAASIRTESRSWVAFGLLLGLLSLGLVTIWFRYGWLTRGLEDIPHELQKYEGYAKDASHLFLKQRKGPEGPSLFCWALIMANSGEEELMRQHRQSNTNIFRCDAWLLLSDFQVSFQDVKSISIGAFNSKRAPWNSWYNVPVFLRAWNKVLEDKRFLLYDWTVKADMDTFFCHQRLRERLGNAHVPKDEACIWLNYDADKNPGPLDFLGPIEIFSTGAMKLYQRSHAKVCPRPHPQTQGEDAFMKDCMLKLGVKTRMDYSLLQNACDWCEPLHPEQCADRGHVAFHPFKKVELYSECLAHAADCIGPSPWR